jgi:hybrid cluster-associated redox disulfide protein
MKVTKEMTIGQVIRANPQAAQILMSFGMGCIGCPFTGGDTGRSINGTWYKHR